jgi:hypothetical protein
MANQNASQELAHVDVVFDDQDLGFASRQIAGIPLILLC